MSVFPHANFPIPVIGPVRSALSLSSLLSQAFGENAQFIAGAWLAYYGEPILQERNFQYWRMNASYVLAATQEIERLDAAGTAAINLTGNEFGRTLISNVGFDGSAFRLRRTGMSASLQQRQLNFGSNGNAATETEFGLLSPDGSVRHE